ncbi:hypothetical protein [Streptomyces sparsus]
MSIPGDPPHNPYAQPSPPNPYAQPAGNYAMPPPGHGVPPGPPAGPPRTGLPGWAWGLSGVLLASAVWAAAVIASGGLKSEPEADLAGYHYHQDLCGALDTSALRGHYAEDSSRGPTGYHARHEALDSSQCSVRLKAPNARSYDTTYVSFQAAWHKKTDPAGEFAARMEAYKSRSSDTSEYGVEAVDGLGEEAYLVTDRAKRDDRLRWAMLAVRDGWVETTMEWSEITSRSSADRMTKDRLQEMLTTDTRATLEALKKPGGEGGNTPSRGEGDI